MRTRKLTKLHRDAGKVKRFHTAFTIQTQTISDHVYNMIRIYQAIWGYPPEQDWRALVYHDIEELEMGDWPHWVCLLPEVPEIKHRLEKRFWADFGMEMPESSKRITVCDWIECVEFMLSEAELGNGVLREGLHKLWDKIELLIDTLPEKDLIHAYLCMSGISDRIWSVSSAE